VSSEYDASEFFSVYDKNRGELVCVRQRSLADVKRHAAGLDKRFGIKGRFVPVSIDSTGKWEFLK